jgi:SAM-dependent methyltransferase
MTIEKPEDFYRSYAEYKRYLTPVIKSKQLRWYDREFWGPASCSQDHSVLELGCGTGEFLLYLKRKGVKRFVGVEMDRYAIAAAPSEIRDHVREDDIWRFLENGDPGERYDRIVMLDVLEHFSSGEGVQLLLRLKEALAPDGRVVARVPNMGSPWGGMYQFADITHKAAYTANSLEQLGIAAGFAVERFGPQKRGSPVRRVLEDALHALLGRILTVSPVIWTPNIIVIFRRRDDRR